MRGRKSDKEDVGWYRIKKMEHFNEGTNIVHSLSQSDVHIILKGICGRHVGVYWSCSKTKR